MSKLNPWYSHSHSQWDHKVDMIEWLTYTHIPTYYFSPISWFCCSCMLSRAWLFVTIWIVALQALSVELSSQEYWSGLPFPTPGDHPDPGIESTSLVSPALAGRFFTSAPPGKPIFMVFLLEYFYLLSFSCASQKSENHPHHTLSPNI